MHDRVPNRMRRLLLERQYIVAAHAYDEMAADDLAIWDVESAILNGKIRERQKNRVTSESKYRIHGRTMDGRSLKVITKFGATAKVVVIAVYVV